MFVAVSTFIIANDMAPEVRNAFINRPHLVDNAPGFVRMDVMTAKDNPNEVWLMTYWADEESYQVWYKSHMRESHQDIPKGLKLVPHSSKVMFFDYISS